MTDQITLRGLRVHAQPGDLPVEAKEGRLFVVDVTASLWSLDNAAQTDELAHTLDYASLAKRVHDLVASERWNLIERVAYRVAQMVLEDPQVLEVEVTVHRPEARLDVAVDDVSVTLSRAR
jgi:dihydroneopterin aldolase